MDSSMPGLRSYYRRFMSISGALAGLFAAIPFFSSLFRPGISEYLFPPLGPTSQPIAKAATVSFALALTYIVYSFKESKHIKRRGVGRVQLILLTLSILCFLLFLLSIFYFTRNVDIPAQNASVTISIGYERSGYAIENFSDRSDEDMLRSRGFGEEEIRRLWVPESIAIARTCLFGFYIGTLLPFVGIFSLGVLYDLVSPTKGTAPVEPPVRD